MTNKNGRAARPKTAPMVMAGSVSFELKRETVERILKGETVKVDVLDHDPNAHEFILELGIGQENRVLGFEPWLDVAPSRVTIENSVAVDGELEHGMEITFRDGSANRYSVHVNPDQAEVLGAVFQHYAQAWKSIDALKADQPTA